MTKHDKPISICHYCNRNLDEKDKTCVWPFLIHVQQK